MEQIQVYILFIFHNTCKHTNFLFQKPIQVTFIKTIIGQK